MDAGNHTDTNKKGTLKIVFCDNIEIHAMRLW